MGLGVLLDFSFEVLDKEKFDKSCFFMEFYFEIGFVLVCKIISGRGERRFRKVFYFLYIV